MGHLDNCMDSNLLQQQQDHFHYYNYIIYNYIIILRYRVNTNYFEKKFTVHVIE